MPFRGKLDGRSHAIAGLNKPLFGAVDGSELDLVLVRPAVTGNPAGAVVGQIGSNNTIKAQVIDGTVDCADTINCNVGLIAGGIQGDNNYIEQYNSTGRVRAEGHIREDELDSSGGYQRASLGIGSVEGDNNTLVQSNVSGSALAAANTVTLTQFNDSDKASLTTTGTVGVASTGPGYIAGEGNTVIQEDIDANITSNVTGLTGRELRGDAIGAKSESSLGAGVVNDNQFTLRQTKLKGNVTAQVSGEVAIHDEDCLFHDNCSVADSTSMAQGVQAVATLGASEINGGYQGITQIDTEGRLEAEVSGNVNVTNHYNSANTVPPRALRGAIVGRYDSEAGLLRLYSGSVGEMSR